MCFREILQKIKWTISLFSRKCKLRQKQFIFRQKDFPFISRLGDLEFINHDHGKIVFFLSFRDAALEGQMLSCFKFVHWLHNAWPQLAIHQQLIGSSKEPLVLVSVANFDLWLIWFYHRFNSRKCYMVLFLSIAIIL